ncbi:MAG: regulatory protein GemA [Magnetococcus sp. YQC-5]
MPTRSQLAVIHIAKKALALTEEHYRAALGRFGVESSKDLTGQQAEELIGLFRHWGWDPRPSDNKPTRIKRFRPASDKAKYINKIIKMLSIIGKLGREHNFLAYADGMARQMFFRDQKNVTLFVEHCTIPQLIKIIQALEMQAARLKDEAR